MERENKMEIITEIINGKEIQLIKVVLKNIFTKKNMVYKFKPFKLGEFKKLHIIPTNEAEQGTAASNINPVVFLINSMMIEGEKINDDTDQYVLNKLRSELQDFLS